MVGKGDVHVGLEIVRVGQNNLPTSVPRCELASVMQSAYGRCYRQCSPVFDAISIIETAYQAEGKLFNPLTVILASLIHFALMSQSEGLPQRLYGTDQPMKAGSSGLWEYCIAVTMHSREQSIPGVKFGTVDEAVKPSPGGRIL